MLSRFINNPCNWYFLMWIIQIVHVPLRIYGDETSVLVLFFLYAWSLFYFIVANIQYQNSKFLRSWNLLFLMFLVYGIFDLLTSASQSRQYIIDHFSSMLPLYPFYVYSKKGYLTKGFFKFWSIVLIPVAFEIYFYGQTLALNRFIGQNVEGVTNNMGYSIAMIIPFFYFWKEKPLVQYSGLAILTILTILTLKRGAIVVSAIALFAILLHRRRDFKGYKKILFYLVEFCFVLGIFYFIQKQTISNNYFMDRYEQTINGDTSARGEIYSNAYNYYVNVMPLTEKIFGLGANGCAKAINTEAHNDWLETLISLGLIGFIVFLRLWVKAYKEYKVILNPEIKFLFGIVALMIFARTFFSMSIGDIYIYSTSLLGFCLANSNNSDQELV